MSHPTSNERSLIDRLFDAQVASCSCVTKTPAHEYHDPMCRYRLFYEAWLALDRQQRQPVTLNGFQARMLLKFIDGDDDCEVCIAELPERTSTEGERMEAGLYVWLAEYAEEGCLLLTDEPTAEGFCAEPKQVETPVAQQRGLCPQTEEGNACKAFPDCECGHEGFVQTRDSWQPMHSAPRDGSAFLAFGLHDTDNIRGMHTHWRVGDNWRAIVLFDVYREVGMGGSEFVFSKDGARLWSAPRGWMPLPEIPAVKTSVTTTEKT